MAVVPGGLVSLLAVEEWSRTSVLHVLCKTRPKIALLLLFCIFIPVSNCPALLHNTMRLTYKHLICRIGPTRIWTWITHYAAQFSEQDITSQTLNKTLDFRATGPTPLPLMGAKWLDLDFGLKRFSGSFSKWISYNLESKSLSTKPSFEDAHCGPKTDFTVFILPTLFAGLCVRGAFQTLFLSPESQIAGCWENNI